nr:MFS transporter [Nonomuraea sp. FMUSA5-5]
MWAGETASMLGGSVAAVALPLVAVVTLRAGTLAVGLLTAAAWLPWLVIGLPAGAWVDRLRKRPVMLACDVVSMAVFASVPVAAWLGGLTMAHLLVVATAGGAAKVFFTLAYRAYLPILVGGDRLLDANTKLQCSESAAQIAGPGLAGLLAQAFGAVSGVLADAVSFGVSALCLRSVRTREPRPPAPAERRLLKEILDGVRFVVPDPYLRPLTLFSALSNVALMGYHSIQVVFLARELGAGAGVVASNILTSTFRQRYCPPELFARITAGTSALNYGAVPLGGLLGGTLGEALGVRETMWLMACVQLGALVVLLLSPIRRARDFPFIRSPRPTPDK